MKVILQKDIPNLGDAGDIKDVADGYARNYLIPQKLVLVANASSKKAIEHQNKLIKIKKEKRKKISEKVMENMSGLVLDIDANVGEEGKLFGSVTSMDIARGLKEKGFEIDKRKISLDQPIKQMGEYDISVKLDEGLTAELKVNVKSSGVVVKKEPEVEPEPEAEVEPEAEIAAADSEQPAEDTEISEEKENREE